MPRQMGLPMMWKIKRLMFKLEDRSWFCCEQKSQVTNGICNLSIPPGLWSREHSVLFLFIFGSCQLALCCCNLITKFEASGALPSLDFAVPNL